MNSPSLLLFDLGGVLTESVAFENLSHLLLEPLDGSTIRERWLSSSSVRRFERGEISPEDFAERFIAEWNIRLSPQAFLNEFVSWPRGYFPGALDMIHALRKTHRVACLSNSNVLHWERLTALEDDFDITFFSHQLGVIKPDREAFMLALSRCNVEPSEVCFFDDCLDNIHAAQSLGITAFHVEGFESVRQVLHEQGLIAG